MKRLLLTLLLFASLQADDVVKGQTYYLYILKDKLGYNGAVFAKQHTKKEWEILFANNAQRLKDKLAKESPELKTFVKTEKFKKITPFLKAFSLYYAKDAEQSPQCN